MSKPNAEYPKGRKADKAAHAQREYAEAKEKLTKSKDGDPTDPSTQDK
ncbi:MAG: hypothetical protein AB7E85_08645 [Pseudobdellovibrionaceae bacterium]|jgi:hypothetical protein